MITWYPNYLYSFDIPSLDNKQLYKDCLVAEKYIKDNLSVKISPERVFAFGNYTSAAHTYYNLFTLTIPSLSKLYKELSYHISPLLDYDKTYYIRCWLNVFREKENIDWHSHFPPEDKAWHGFYCVNVKDSYTSYAIPTSKRIINIPSKEGRLVIGKSDGDQHKSSPWKGFKKPRITIAFDIFPVGNNYHDNKEIILNHYIPFK